jgi:hypothetical protein
MFCRLCVHTDLVHHEKWDPITPDELQLGRRGARYVEFASKLLPTVIYARELRAKAMKQPLSKFIPANLEAFGIVLYTNCFDVWMYAVEKQQGVDHVEEIKPTYKFTGEARGSKKYGGWNEEGLILCNTLTERLMRHRKTHAYGAEFDKSVAQIWSKEFGGRSNAAMGTAVEVVNSVDELLGEMTAV